jgi:glycosyltransferase involved in cell wall biosynthesis
LHNSPLPEVFRCDKKSPEAARTLIHCGNLSTNRGMMQILDALAVVKEKTPVKFIQVGVVRERNRDRERFEERVKALGLEKEAEVTGWVTYGKMVGMLNRGSIGLAALQPTRNNYGTLHNKTFSYMSTGLAVIGPRGSDTERIINETGCGLAVDMNDSQALAEAIMSLIDNRERCHQLGQNGRKAIEESFGWHIMERKLWRIYEDLNK